SLILSSIFISHAPAPPELSPLSLHDALPIFVHEHRQGLRGLQSDVLPSLTGCGQVEAARVQSFRDAVRVRSRGDDDTATNGLERSEEHTSELQSPCKLVCRLLLEKKKQNKSD